SPMPADTFGFFIDHLRCPPVILPWYTSSSRTRSIGRPGVLLLSITNSPSPLPVDHSA
ncbi:unnamed protein product, partial [Dovyalis caffra]